MSSQNKTIKTGPLQRALTFERSAVDAEKRTVALTFSSETPYERWFGMEVLDHSPSSIRLGRLKDGGAVLVDHKGDQVGVVEEVSIGADRRGHAVLRFGKGQRADEIYQDICDGIRRNVSVGYLIHSMVMESEDKGTPTYRVNDWEPYEISMVSIPADTSVGVGRAENFKDHETVITQGVKNMNEPENAAPVAPAPVAVKDHSGDERRRCIEITNMGRKHDLNDEATRAIGNGMSVDAFRQLVLDKISEKSAKPIQAINPEIGMSQKEARQFSIIRAINCLANKRGLDGIEREASEAVAKLIGREAQGFFVPHEVRALNVQTATAGGFLVQDGPQGQSMIEMLRNSLALEGMGATTLSGLVGNCPIPKMTGGATASWCGESEEVAATQQAFAQVLLQPKRIAAQTAFTKQLLAQSSYDVEGLVRGDLAKVLALAIDLGAINGAGGKAPLGILNTAGIGTVTFSGAATFAKAVEFETDVEDANVQITSGGYLTTPVVKGKWKTIEESTGTAQWLWRGNEVNGYKARASKQIPTNRVIFANWSDLLLAYWEGMDVVVDPYTLAANNQIRIVVNQFADAAVRHPGSFSASTDTGAA